MGFLRYLAFRLGRTAIVVFGLLLVTFVLTRTLTHPVDIILGPNSTAAQRATLNKALGFDKPLPTQFIDYISRVVRGDFGQSLSLDRPALGAIVERVPASLLLAVAAILIGSVLGLGLGLLGGLRPGSTIDRLATGMSSLSLAVPDFWVGLMFIILFSVKLGWLPTGGYGGFTDLRYVVLPAVTLAQLPAGRLARVVRESVVEEMAKDYVIAARARGMRTRQIVHRHLIKNIAVASSTIIGFDFLLFFSGSGATVEVVFGWPGIGRMAIAATLASDIILVTALVVVIGLMVSIGNIVLDTIHAGIDRRSFA